MIYHYQKKYFFLAITAILLFVSCSEKVQQESSPKPNVIIVMTDDQGIGDFGFTGNPYIKTPVIDKLADQSLNLTNFYVAPVCAPTRASLMTGRYSERTGVYDTYKGGAIMSDSEITIAEILQENGYETGIFGKWHLGDNYPYRPFDQGFETSVVFRAGGVGQPGDIFNFFARDSSYFNPVLFKNGEPVKTIGYCSDVYTDETIEFINKNQEKSEKPFFAYLSFNAPHTPLQLPQEYYNMYKDIEFDASKFEVYDEIVEKMTAKDIEAAKKVYGMVSNIDDNIGKLIQSLKEQGIYDNTIIVFLTDNGPQQNRYKMGLRERKSSVFGGGVRVPCLIHYPEKFKEKQELDATIAHIDLLPSILDLCGLEKVNHKIDGMSFFSSDNDDYSAFENRTLFFEWGRGFLTKYRNFSALKNNFKLVGNTSAESSIENFELYDIESDPQEKNNILAENTEIANALKAEIDDWYNEIISEENNNKIYPAFVGTSYENPVLLNRNDAKGGQKYWDVKVVEDGIFDIQFHFQKEIEEPGEMHLQMYPYNLVQKNTKPMKELTIEGQKLKKGDYLFEPYYKTGTKKFIMPFYVSIRRID
jgi:arylsulfatase A-like enzyme